MSSRSFVLAALIVSAEAFVAPGTTSSLHKNTKKCLLCNDIREMQTMPAPGLSRVHCLAVARNDRHAPAGVLTIKATMGRRPDNEVGGKDA